jgi:hypothetical protein
LNYSTRFRVLISVAVLASRQAVVCIGHQHLCLVQGQGDGCKLVQLLEQDGTMHMTGFAKHIS